MRGDITSGEKEMRHKKDVFDVDIRWQFASTQPQLEETIKKIDALLRECLPLLDWSAEYAASKDTVWADSSSDLAERIRAQIGEEK